ncbi:hypothetical protein [Mangrovicoccus sp. HB161399]|uniref:hypothetical protein n=1 Tax=Mangrovicoccus sp. HB161399 TaxID=2720392 RepID=UPI0015577174|nr:hypothetical protein [Mangrovicoccus sp. HB161399]
MAELTARRSFVYASRRLQPGQDFTTRTERDAKILIAIGKAKRRAAPAEAAMAPAADAPSLPEISVLRSAYEQASGRRPFMGWDAETLAAKIGALTGATD